MSEKKYYTATEISKMLGISRVAVFKKIKKDDIRAIKIGRNFAIPASEVASILDQSLTDRQKATIEKAVGKTFKDYGETLKLLGET
ncbi:MAG: hypothetical protein A2840_01995 [Candidatus Buchananbacteria bacterium RIFCSPHIGHO2_01_FULL_47_11b]|uniref:Helix-turn-helix domain-containing protein n=1 Tax=Candidatus Buchananbacteria bacterium RIFCSPHIGHO2_01_FULL_47_11b TaxID=1797537 RepID=A0A1G1Y7H4_9BACT|nr:MAG: hypothetical protein A2840_01995 [Candidatus Buchananbacteria bacterium RIFCSPHIGHO2_01_FULL_47_11b]